MASTALKAASNRRNRRRRQSSSATLSSDFSKRFSLSSSSTECCDQKIEEQLNRAIQELEPGCYIKEVKQAFLAAHQGSLPQITTIVCYGIGSFVDSVTSRFQLALALLLKEWLHCDEMSLFDPCLSSHEKNFLCGKLNCLVIEANEECRRAVDTLPAGKTLFFMPHLDKPFFNNLLWSNWRRSSLEKLLILGNSFNEMRDFMPTRTFKTEYLYIHEALRLGVVQEKAIANVFKFSDVFNDMSLHAFCAGDVNESNLMEVYNSDPPIYIESCQEAFEDC